MTYFAMSFDQTRYVLNGSLFVIGPKTLRVVATDGRRLSMIESPIQLPKDFEKNPKQIIVPAKAISELLKTLGTESDVSITISENQALFNLGRTTIISRLIEGEFPKYEQVIPKELKDKLRIGREGLFLAVKRASILTSQESQAIKLEVLKDKLVISKVTPELGESREELPVSYGGPGLVIGFNPSYLLDVLKNMDRPEVALELSSSEKPGVIRTEDGYVYVVLPMQIN
jgi:DNA polymerase-3 subunit beta